MRKFDYVMIITIYGKKITSQGSKQYVIRLAHIKNKIATYSMFEMALHSWKITPNMTIYYSPLGDSNMVRMLCIIMNFYPPGLDFSSKFFDLLHQIPKYATAYNSLGYICVDWENPWQTEM